MATLLSTGTPSVASLLIEKVRKVVEDGIEKKTTSFDRMEKKPPLSTNSLGFRMPIQVEDNASEEWHSDEGFDYAPVDVPVWKNLVITYTRVSKSVGFTGDVADLDKDPDKITGMIGLATAKSTRKLKKSYNRMFFGDGSGEIGRYLSGTGTTSIVFTSASGNFFGARKFDKRARIQFYDSTLATARNSGQIFTVVSIDRANKTVVFDAAPTLSANDVAVFANSVSASFNGLANIIANTGSIHGLSRTTYPALNASVLAVGGSNLTQSLFDSMINQETYKTGEDGVSGDSKQVIWSPVQKQAYLNLGYDLKQFVSPGAQKLDLGFDGVTASGNPTSVDVDCSDDSIFMPDFNYINRFELLPTQPRKSNDGGIMFQRNAASGTGHSDNYNLYIVGKLQIGSWNPAMAGTKMTGLGINSGVNPHIA